MSDVDPKPTSSGYADWKGWSAQAEFGTRFRGDDSYFSRELREVTSHVGKVVDVLEIGFGDGQFLSYARSRGWNVSGTELLPEQVAAGRKAGFAVYADTELSELQNASFDVIAAFDVLEHIPEADTVAFLSVLASKLRPGGAMILRYPNADSWLGNAFQYGDPTHVSAIGSIKMQYLAALAQLKILKYRAATRRGFATSAVHGLHAATAGTFARAVGFVQSAIYFPGLPVVLSSSNVVCVLYPAETLK